MSSSTHTNGAAAASDLNSMAHNVSQYGKDLVHASEEKIQVGVNYAKKYPVHTAIGAGIAGFALGFIVKSFR